MKIFYALVLKDEDSAYGIVFPDIAGCFSAGDTYDEAIRNARVGLQAHVESLCDNGRPVPEPRSLEMLMTDPEIRDECACSALVPVPLLPLNDA